MRSVIKEINCPHNLFALSSIQKSVIGKEDEKTGWKKVKKMKRTKRYLKKFKEICSVSFHLYQSSSHIHDTYYLLFTPISHI